MDLTGLSRTIRSRPAIPRRMPRPLLFKEQLIYEQLASQSVHGLRENLTGVWSRQPLTIEQLRRPPR